MSTLSIPAPLPSPAEDAESLRKAVQGFGTDEKTLVSILGRRNAHQRTLIRRAYEEIYQEDLIKRLESEIHGEFERAVYRWIFEPAERDAILVNVALKKSTPNFRAIVEISCTRSPGELLAAKHAYHARYKRSLEEDVAYHTTGNIRKLLFALASSYRYDGDEVDSRLAESEAKLLHKSLEQKGSDYEEFVRILSTRSRAQLNATLNRYKDHFGAPVSKALGTNPSDELLVLLRAAIRCFSAPRKYFEKVLRTCLKGLGTDEGAVTRVIVTRAEKDLREISEEFYRRNSISLKNMIAKETSGDYKTFLLTLLGGPEA